MINYSNQNPDQFGVSSLPNEIWKDIFGYEGAYQVSNFGRIKRLKIKGDKILDFHSLPEKLLKPYENGNGYLGTSLFKKRFLIHRLVAIAFLSPIKGKSIVNHKNGIKNDNRADNLEWSNPSHNMNHAYSLSLKVSKKGEKHGRAKLTDAQVIEIRKSLKSDKLLSEHYNVSIGTIFGIRKGSTWKHLL